MPEYPAITVWGAGLVDLEGGRLMRISGIPGFLLYLGIGALSHLLFVGSSFDWDSAWTWAVLFGWPLLAGLAFFTVIGAILLVATVVQFLLILLNPFDRPGRRNRPWEGW